MIDNSTTIIVLLVLIIIVVCTILYFNNNNSSSLETVPPKIKSINNTNIIKTYSDLINEYDSIPRTPGGIPKLIIKTSWHNLKKLPPPIKDVLDTTIRLNPDYQVYYFDDDDINNFMKSYGVREYAAFNKLIPGAYKADLFRYCILYKYGGCYSDIGHVMLKSFDYIIGDNKLVVVKDKPNINYTGIHNALICVVSSSNFIKKLVDLSVENIEHMYYGENSLDITGPVMMGKVFQCYYFNYCKQTLNENYLMNKEGIKILELTRLDDSGINNNQLIQENNNMQLYITDNGVKVIKTKFDNYSEIMYTNNKKHYGELWGTNQVYFTNVP
jgi:hypothetical protein